MIKIYVIDFFLQRRDTFYVKYNRSKLAIHNFLKISQCHHVENSGMAQAIARCPIGVLG